MIFVHKKKRMNPSIKITKTELLSDNWYLLNKVTYEFTPENGEPEIQRREVFDRGNGAAILLYNKERQTVILTCQFRLPTFLNGNESGMMIEVCAGMLDENNPEDCIKRETEEETGYRIQDVKKVFEAYMSPGAVTEILHFFTAEYQPEMKVSEGGGLASEHEYIEVLELNFNEAMDMVYNGKIKDAKTIMLLLHVKSEGLLT
jgi:GDP-mannose pyrophosphatase NudK